MNSPSYKQTYKQYTKSRPIKKSNVTNVTSILKVKDHTDLWEINQALNDYNGVINIDIVNQIYNSLNKNKDTDIETQHELEDNLMSKFIKNITENNIPFHLIKGIASSIKKINDLNLAKWYA